MALSGSQWGSFKVANKEALEPPVAAQFEDTSLRPDKLRQCRQDRYE